MSVGTHDTSEVKRSSSRDASFCCCTPHSSVPSLLIFVFFYYFFAFAFAFAQRFQSVSIRTRCKTTRRVPAEGLRRALRCALIRLCRAMSRSSEKNDGSGEGQPSAEAAEEAVEVELFSLKKHLIPINKKMTLSQLYEECASGVEDVSPADIRLFLDEAAQEAEQIRPLDTAPADLKKRLGSLATPVKPGTALKAWWASSIMNLEEQEFLSEKIKNVFKKPLGPCLYRGSQHGWTRADFEQHCAMKGPLVVVVQAAGGLAATSAAAGGHIQKRKFGAFLSTNLEKDLEKGRFV